MKRRWKLLLGFVAALFVAALAPILYIETACSSPPEGLAARAPYRSLLPDATGRRAEARTWLTYPEWYIVHSADSFGRFLATRPASDFSYLRQIGGFWSGMCQVNRVAGGSDAAADAKIMLYTIGLSFSAEMLIKGLYENTFGRLSLWLSGWPSADDLYSTQVQQRYGAFMHETPWYAFPFGEALGGLWRTSEPEFDLRHWERRLGLSMEYGGKAAYTGAIGWLSGATLGRDERTLRFVARADPAALRSVDPRFRPVARVGEGLVAVEAPRYAQFTELMLKLAQTSVGLVEIAGNDDIFVTLLMREGTPLPSGAEPLMQVSLEDRPGWVRRGVTVRVERLLPTIRQVRAASGQVEHIYDY